MKIINLLINHFHDMHSYIHWYLCRYRELDICTNFLNFNAFVVSILYSILGSVMNSIFESGCLKKFFKYKIPTKGREY